MISQYAFDLLHVNSFKITVNIHRQLTFYILFLFNVKCSASQNKPREKSMHFKLKMLLTYLFFFGRQKTMPSSLWLTFSVILLIDHLFNQQNTRTLVFGIQYWCNSSKCFFWLLRNNIINTTAQKLAQNIKKNSEIRTSSYLFFWDTALSLINVCIIFFWFVNDKVKYCSILLHIQNIRYKVLYSFFRVHFF